MHSEQVYFLYSLRNKKKKTCW